MVLTRQTGTWQNCCALRSLFTLASPTLSSMPYPSSMQRHSANADAMAEAGEAPRCMQNASSACRQSQVRRLAFAWHACRLSRMSPAAGARRKKCQVRAIAHDVHVQAMVAPREADAGCRLCYPWRVVPCELQRFQQRCGLRLHGCVEKRTLSAQTQQCEWCHSWQSDDRNDGRAGRTCASFQPWVATTGAGSHSVKHVTEEALHESKRLATLQHPQPCNLIMASR